MLSVVDSGQWPVAGTPGCGAGSQPVPITWGGPLCTFRSDNIESYDVKTRDPPGRGHTELIVLVSLIDEAMF